MSDGCKEEKDMDKRTSEIPKDVRYEYAKCETCHLEFQLIDWHSWAHALRCKDMKFPQERATELGLVTR